jgi:putative transcriptional regulator
MNLPSSRISWPRVTVKKVSEIFASIKQGLKEAVAYSEGKCPEAVVHEFTPIDVKNVRAKMGMSQNEFAAAFGISVSTLRHWEKGDRVPQGPALVLLNVVEKEPQAVLNALAGQ